MESWRRELYHYGVSKMDGAPGRGSGRYPLGSGKDPRSERNYYDAENDKWLEEHGADYYDKEYKKAKIKSALYTAAGAAGGMLLTTAVSAAAGYASPVLLPVGGLLTIAGISGFAKIGQKAISSIKEKKLRSLYEQKNNSLDGELPKKTKKMSPDEDMTLVNPFFKTGNDGYTKNCAQCSLAYSLRRKGYDVSASKTNKGMTVEEIRSMYKKTDEPVKINLMELRDKKIKINQMNKWFDNFAKNKNSIYNLCIWGESFGHSIILEVNNGKPIIRDTQANVSMTVNSFIHSDYANMLESMEAIRLDNAIPDYNNIQYMVVPGYSKKAG